VTRRPVSEARYRKGISPWLHWPQWAVVRGSEECPHTLVEPEHHSLDGMAPRGLVGHGPEESSATTSSFFTDS